MRELIQSRDEEMQRVFREDLAEWLSHLIDQNIEAEKLLPELGETRWSSSLLKRYAIHLCETALISTVASPYCSTYSNSQLV